MAKYTVNEKASFVHGGRSYKPGDEIDGDLFNKAALEAAIKGKKLITKEQAQAAAKSTETKPPKPETGGEKSTDNKPPENQTGGSGTAGNGNAPPASTSGNVEKSLDEMNYEELKAIAIEKKIPYQNMKKEDLLAAIKAARAGEGK